LNEKLIGTGMMQEIVEQSLKQKVEHMQKEEIIKKMQIKYNKYFKHWRDFDLLTCILAMIGLVLAIVDVCIFAFILFIV
jgi:hypothetical protein